MKTIFKLSMKQLARKKRLILIVLLAILPAILAGIISSLSNGDDLQESDMINSLLDAMLIAVILPLVTIVLATRVFGDEMEDRTLSYLILKPVPRWKIVLPKMLSAIALCAPVLIISGVITTVFIFDGGVRAAAASGLALLVGVISYTVIFTWVGLITNHALGFGIVYAVLWEGVVSSFLSSVRYLSVRGYTLAVMHGIDGKGFETLDDRVIEFPAGIAGAIIVTLVFFFLAVRRLRRMDVP